jgi:hypothetical protein
MRISLPLRVIGLGLAALVVAAAPAHATDYFSLDLRHAEFLAEPLGPAMQFVPPPVSAPLPVATIREPASPTQAVAATSRRVHITRVRETARKPHRDPLNAFASYSRPRNQSCAGANICVFDGVHGRWHAK